MNEKTVVFDASLVERLLRGSESLDRKKQEINRVIKLVLGLVYVDSEEERIIVDEPNLRFILDVASGPVRKNQRVRIMVRNSSLRPDFFYVYSTLGDDHALPAWAVNMIHNKLPAYIEGMSNLFPWLLAEAEPLLREADGC